MFRVDIVVFPNGGREIFGQVRGTTPEVLAIRINEFLATLESADKPRKFTGYYDESGAGDIEWAPYDENNPIVRVPTDDVSDEGEWHYESVELAHIPEEHREKYLSNSVV